MNLDKDGEKVYIVHQQDRATKAQPVDWYYGKKTPTLHIGLPCDYCDHSDKKTTYDEKIVAGEEIASLTGCYSTPKCENLIVFSDEYFATVYKGNIIKNLIMDCQSYTKYRPNETTGGIFVSWRRKEELPTGA